MIEPLHLRLHAAAERDRPVLRDIHGCTYILTGTSLGLDTGMLRLRLEPSEAPDRTLMHLFGLKLGLRAWGDIRFIRELEHWLREQGFDQIRNLRWADQEHQDADTADLDFDPVSPN